MVIPSGGKITGEFSINAANGRSLVQTTATAAFSPTYLTIVPGANNTFDPPAGVTVLGTANTTFNSGISLQTFAAECRLGTFVIGAGTYLPLTVYSNNAEAMRVDLSGNVGIANTAPADKLSVTGNAYVSGNVTGGNLVTGGLVTATGNVQAGNLRTSGIISATGNVTAGNVSATNITGTLTTAAQTNITSIGTLAALTVSGQANFNGQLKIPTSIDASPVAGSIYWDDSTGTLYVYQASGFFPGWVAI